VELGEGKIEFAKPLSASGITPALWDLHKAPLLVHVDFVDSAEKLLWCNHL
jgi:hypothetical protein